MNGTLPLVGFGTNIFVEGLLSLNIHPERNLCLRIWHYAKNHAFRVLVLQTVLDEFDVILERETQQSIRDNELESLLNQCLIVYEGPPSRVEIDQEKPRLWAMMRDGDDALIAVSVRKAQPHYFVSMNTAHWKRSLSAYLGTKVRSPKEFCEEMGIPLTL